MFKKIVFITILLIFSSSIANARLSNNSPTATGMGENQAVNDNATIKPFANVILDDQEGDTISVSISLNDNAYGTLSASSVATGTISSVQAILRDIIFTPASNRVAVGSTETARLTITLSDGTLSSSNDYTKIVITSVNDTPTITSTPITSIGENSLYSYAPIGNDADGDDLTWSANTPLPSWLSLKKLFTLQTDTNNPFNGIDIGYYSTPTFVDIDDDGDMDAFTGEYDGSIKYFENNGNDTFTQQTGPNNPFDGIDVGAESKPSFADIDGDGDMDLAIGAQDGNIKYFKNESGTFTQQTGTDNPFDGIDVGDCSAPSFADIDGDGDMDAFIGEYEGNINYYKNNGNDTFTQQTGTDNPFDGIDVGDYSAPSFADIDGDGDMDVFIGEFYGYIKYLENNGNDTFTQQTGTDNPFDGIDVGQYSAPSFADIDGNGDMDAFIGELDGTIKYFKNETLLTGTPTNSDVGELNVNLTLSDGISDVPHDFKILVKSAGEVALAQIGTQADDTGVESDITVVQLNAITPTLTSVVSANIDAYNNYIDANANSFASPATQAEVQAMITAVNALTKIQAYANDNTNPAPTVQDYTDAGVTGVDADNLDAVNAKVASNTTGTDTLAQIQTIVTTAITVAPTINPSNGTIITGTGEVGAIVTIYTSSISYSNQCNSGTCFIGGPNGAWTMRWNPSNGTIDSSSDFSLMEVYYNNIWTSSHNNLTNNTVYKFRNTTTNDELIATWFTNTGFDTPLDILETATVDDNGNWTITPSEALTNGVSLTVSQVDLAGNSSSASAPQIVVDNIPDDFSFTTKTNQALSTSVESNMVTITGIANSIDISIVGGEYKINSGSWTSANGTIDNDDTVTLRLTSSSSYNSNATATLTVGDVTKSFNVITETPTPTTPSTGGGSTGGGSTYTPPTTPTPEPEEEEMVEPIVEEEKVVVQPITEPISEPIVVERQTGNAEQTGTKPELDNVTKLYIATFGRAPESAGSVYWLYESKLNLEDIARSFFDQEETKGKYPEGFSNYDFIVAIYNHVYDRDPDQEGGDYWLEELESGKVEKGLFILAVINGGIGEDALMLEKQTIAGVNFVKSGVQNLDMAKKVIDDIQR